MGAGWNLRRVYSLTSGKYFKWAAQDNFCQPTLFEKCIDALEADQSLVLAQSNVSVIDQHGSFVEDYEWPMRTDSVDAVVRFTVCC
jgi:hypothetical protein